MTEPAPDARAATLADLAAVPVERTEELSADTELRCAVCARGSRFVDDLPIDELDNPRRPWLMTEVKVLYEPDQVYRHGRPARP